MKVLSLNKLSAAEWVELWHLYNDSFPLSKWWKKYFINHFSPQYDNDSGGIVLKKNSLIIGFALGKYNKNRPALFHLSSLCVAKKYRGNGYATLLLKYLFEEISKSKRAKKITLHFRESNDLQKFYTKHGFSGHRVDGTYSNGERRHYMEIRLQ